jgi:hypothetical protein
VVQRRHTGDEVEGAHLCRVEDVGHDVVEPQPTSSAVAPGGSPRSTNGWKWVLWFQDDRAPDATG